MHNICEITSLLTGEEETIHGDNSHLGAEERPEAVIRKRAEKQSRYEIRRRDRERSSDRAKAEHVFAAVKHPLQFWKTRYRRLQERAAKLNMLFALVDLIMAA